MKKDLTPSTHPVDRFFQEQEPQMPIEYDPQNWSRLETLLDAPVLAEEGAGKTAVKGEQRSDNWQLPLLGLLLAIFLGLGWWYYSPPSLKESQSYPQKELNNLPPASEISEQLTPAIAAEEEVVAESTVAARQEETEVERGRWKAIATLPSRPLPLELKSTQTKAPLRLQLRETSGGAPEEVFIFW